MAKKKSSGGLITKIVALVFAVLSFVAMAFPFMTAIVSLTVAGRSTSESASSSFSEWLDSLSTAQEFGSDKVGGYVTAKVFMIIALIAIAIVAVLVVVKFFMDHKIINLLLFIASLVALIASIAFLIAFVAGGLQMSSFGDYMTALYIPNAGSIILGVSGIVTAALGLKLRKA